MPEKGIDNLISAVKKIQSKRKIHLKIIGKGHIKRILMKKTKNDKCIEWVGFLKNQEEIAKIYSQADLTCLPTRWDEAFSLVPVESIACGTPVLATNRGGNPEIVIPNLTGILINKGDVDTIANVLLNVKKSMLYKLRESSRNFFLENYTYNMWGSAHETLYNKLI